MSAGHGTSDSGSEGQPIHLVGFPPALASALASLLDGAVRPVRVRTLGDPVKDGERPGLALCAGSRDPAAAEAYVRAAAGRGVGVAVLLSIPDETLSALYFAAGAQAVLVMPVAAELIRKLTERSLP